MKKGFLSAAFLLILALTISNHVPAYATHEEPPVLEQIGEDLPQQQPNIDVTNLNWVSQQVFDANAA